MPTRKMTIKGRPSALTVPMSAKSGRGVVANVGGPVWPALTRLAPPGAPGKPGLPGPLRRSQQPLYPTPSSVPAPASPGAPAASAQPEEMVPAPGAEETLQLTAEL